MNKIIINNRYVKSNQKMYTRKNRKINYSGKSIEALICLAFGSVVLYLLCMMCITHFKQFKDDIDSLQTAQSNQVSYYDYILNDNELEYVSNVISKAVK